MLDIILITYPLLLYLIFIVLEDTIDMKGKNILFVFFSITSIYLIIKYNCDINIIKIIVLLYILKFIRIKRLYLILIFILLNLVLFPSNIFITCIYALISYILVMIMDKLEKIISIHSIEKDIENEKKLRETLFKVTHEIKNPLAVIKGYIDMLDTSNNKQVVKYIPIIREEVDRTLLLMNDFLSLTKLDVFLEPMDLSILLDDIIDEFRVILDEKHIKFNYDIIDNELMIMGDYNRLKQVFINLIKNSVEADSSVIDLKVKINKYIEINVIDNGIGIKDINKIGEAFYTTKKYGTGLGVKMCKEIIEAHDALIKYEKVKGTKVIIKIKKLK